MGGKASPQKGQPAKRLRVYPRLWGAATATSEPCKPEKVTEKQRGFEEHRGKPIV
jgi:hypothetical protein